MTVNYYFKEIIDKNGNHTSHFEIFSRSCRWCGKKKEKLAIAFHRYNAELIIDSLNKLP